MGEGTVTKARRPRTRYVIERPRLTTLLDGSRARVILLLAPAGYGKTTLARQWLHRDERPVAWYTASGASTDVAALSAQLAAVVEPFAEGAERTLLRHLKASQSPQDDAESLAESLAGTLQTWPEDVWLTIDDYQFMSNAPAAERFVEVLLEKSPLRVLVTTRQLPSWASARRVIYGEIAVFDREDLEMTNSEASAVLSRMRPRAANAAVTAAKGWSAVIRLVALTGQTRLTNPLPPDLERYLAEEIYETTPAAIQEALLRLVPFPVLPMHLVQSILGSQGRRICEKAHELGYLTADGPVEYEFHPLLRAFLEARLSDLPTRDEFVSRAFSVLLKQQRWDSAFSLLCRFEMSDLVDPLLDAALDSLLTVNRVATIRRWIDFASTRTSSPLLELARAELARRTGEPPEGLFRAVNATGTLAHHHLSRAYAVASECAHFVMDGDAALRYVRLAENSAESAADARRALWAMFGAAWQFGNAPVEPVIERLENLGDESPANLLRLATGRLAHSLLGGNIESARQRGLQHLALIKLADDPFVRTAFLYQLAIVSLYTGHFAEALHFARDAERYVTASRLEFAVAPVRAAMIDACIGLRQLQRAESLLTDMAGQVRRIDDRFQAAHWHALRARFLLSLGSPDEALHALALPLTEVPTPALRAEFLALRALLGAHIGDDTRALGETALAATPDAQIEVLVLLARAVHALASPTEDLDQLLESAEEVLLSRASYWGLVLAYRAHPPLLGQLRRREAIAAEQLVSLVQGSKDVGLARAVGWNLRRKPPSPKPLLTPREQEVYEHLCRGLTNREIAKLLFISESTVKVHVQHILEKLGARSRTEAALRFYPDS